MLINDSKSRARHVGSTALLLSLVAACVTEVDTTEADSDPPVELTSNALAATPVVPLGMAGSYAILSKTGISTVPPSAITGNMGVSPIAGTAITGFSLIMDVTNVFATSPQVTGKVFAANYAVPTPANLITAIGDMETAYANAAARAPNFSELAGGAIGGLTLAPGVYSWTTPIAINSNVTLKGKSTDVWILKTAQGLTMANATKVFLSGGAVAKNVFWQVSGSVSLGSTIRLEGVVLAKTAITMNTGGSVHGRLLTQTAVTLIKNTVVQP